MKLPTAIFREYDIRGTVGDQLTAEVGRAIGQAVATLAWERLGRAPRLAVGRDNRPSGPALTHGLLSGIEAVGGHGVEVGELPTPALYFATHVLNVDGGVQVTGSHNPPEFNGFKLVLGGEAVAGPYIQGLDASSKRDAPPVVPGAGAVRTARCCRAIAMPSCSATARSRARSRSSWIAAMASRASSRWTPSSASAPTSFRCSASPTVRSPIITPIRRTWRTCATCRRPSAVMAASWGSPSTATATASAR